MRAAVVHTGARRLAGSSRRASSRANSRRQREVDYIMARRAAAAIVAFDSIA